MKVVAYSSNDPVLSGAEVALRVTTRETRVTSAGRFGRPDVSPGRSPKLGCICGRPGVSTRVGETV